MAKRLMDYGFHAPTVSFPVPGTLMIEPTESEPKEELDRFCDAMIAIRGEIQAVATARRMRSDNVLKNAPHTAAMVVATTSGRIRTRASRRRIPLPFVRAGKFWPTGGPDRQPVRRSQPVVRLPAGRRLRGRRPASDVRPASAVRPVSLVQPGGGTLPAARGSPGPAGPHRSCARPRARSARPLAWCSSGTPRRRRAGPHPSARCSDIGMPSSCADLEEELARDAGQQPGVERRREHVAAADDEQVRLRAFGDLAAVIPHHRFERRRAASPAASRARCSAGCST